jgi:hypothetical protein
MTDSTAKQAPAGYRCPGCAVMHTKAPCFPGCGAQDATDRLDEEAQ